MNELQFPLSTGQVCKLLDVAEHKVINPIRAGKLQVPNVGNRRLWMPENVLAVAKILGKDTLEIRNVIAAGTSLDLQPTPAGNTELGKTSHVA